MPNLHGMEHTGGAASARTAKGGFTLIEMITVIIIIGVLSAVVLTKSSILSITTVESTARASELRAQLRFLQLRALKSATVCSLKSNGANYWAFSGTDATATANYLTLPGESSTVVTVADKSMSLSSFTMNFNGYGIPYKNDTPIKVSDVQPLSITITAGGAATILTISPETGFTP